MSDGICRAAGGSAIEAMLCGTPVVCSNYGGFTESVVYGARCFSVDEMISSIREYVSSPVFRPPFRSSIADRYSIDVVSEDWKHCLSQLRTLGTSAEVIR